MIQFLTLYGTVLGLSVIVGSFRNFGKSFAEESYNLGINFFLALSLIPLIYFFGNLLGGISLSHLSFFIFFLGLSGLFWGLIIVIKTEKKYLNKLIHPVFLFPLFVILLLIIFYPFSFKINEWDEFSFWLLFPKQLFYANQLLLPSIPFPQLSRYTPGWPLLLNFTNFLFEKNFSEASTLYPKLISGFAISSIIFDLILKYFNSKDIKNKYSSYSYILPWIIILILDLLDLPYRTFHSNVLIEKPLIDSVCFIFLYYFFFYKKSWQDELLLGLGLVVSLIYKRPLFILLLPILFAQIVKIFKDKKISWRENLLIFMPVMATYYFWTVKTRNFPIDWNLSVDRFGGMLPALISSQSKNIFFTVLMSTSKVILRNPVNSLALIGLFLSIKGKLGPKFKQTAPVLIFFLIIYVLGLYWTYLIAFGSYEAENLASFKRYLYIPLGPLCLFGILALLLFLQNKLEQKLTHKKLMYKKLLRYSLVLFIVAFSYKSIYKCFLPLNHLPLPMILNKELPLMLSLSKKLKIKKPLIQVIDQINSDPHLLYLRYASVGEDESGIAKLFSLTSSVAYAEDPKIVRVEQISRKELLERLEHVDILLIINTDNWIKPILDSVIEKHCDKNDYKKYIFFHNEKKLFDGIEKINLINSL